MKHDPARLLFPALRWNERGFDDCAVAIEHGLRNRVGGFIIFGGTADAIRELTERTQSRADHALLFGSDLERGTGQQAAGLTPLPPAAAIGHLDSPDITRRAALITASEARSIGIHWAFAPVADIDNEPRNPIVGTRSFGDSATQAARHVAAWVAGCHEGGAMCCAKHFPGHGRTTEDSHAGLPHVTLDRATLVAEMEPFRHAIDAGVDAVMTAHVVFDALDPRDPATLSRTIIQDMLRRELGFEGLVVTDGLGMQGILDACGGDEGDAAIAAVNAGCDALIYPERTEHTLDALRAELGRRLSEAHVADAGTRITGAAEQCLRDTPARTDVRSENRAWADRIATDSIFIARGSVRLTAEADLVVIDDDLDGPHPAPTRDTFTSALQAHAPGVRLTDSPSREQVILAIFADVRAWKGRPGLSAAAVTRAERILRAHPDAIVVLFAHPRMAEQIGARNVLACWGGEPIMQSAAAAWLTNSGTP